MSENVYDQDGVILTHLAGPPSMPRLVQVNLIDRTGEWTYCEGSRRAFYRLVKHLYESGEVDRQLGS